MPGDYFWNCVEAMAATFDGDHRTAEENLDIYYHECRRFSPEKLAAVRRSLVKIIGGLARLETRLAEKT